MSIGFQVQNMRVGPYKGVLAFFEVAFGEDDESGFTGLFTVTDFALKTSDSGYYIQAAGRPRMKNGQVVKQKDGIKDQWDNYYNKFATEGAGKDGGYGVTKPAWAFSNQLTEAAVKLYDTLKGKAASAPSGATTKVTDTPRGTPMDDEPEEFSSEELDDLPW